MFFSELPFLVRHIRSLQESRRLKKNTDPVSFTSKKILDSLGSMLKNDCHLLFQHRIN